MVQGKICPPMTFVTFMHKSLRIGLIIIASGLLLPFILQTDLYPFLRYGMFAEPAQKGLSDELFLIGHESEPGKIEVLSADLTGLEPSTLQYLARNHFYRDESDKLLHTLASPLSGGLSGHLYLLRVRDGDTSTVASVSLSKSAGKP